MKVSINIAAISTTKSQLFSNKLLPVPPPALLITREPKHPVRLFTTNNLTLTCVIQLVPEVDTPVSVNSQWTGHSSLSDNQRRVIVSELEGSHPKYESSVTFSTLKSGDSGSYVCSANVSPQTNMSGEVIESSWTSKSLNISVSKYTFHPKSSVYIISVLTVTDILCKSLHTYSSESVH